MQNKDENDSFPRSDQLVKVPFNVAQETARIDKKREKISRADNSRKFLIVSCFLLIALSYSVLNMGLEP